MITDIHKRASDRMKKSIESLKQDFSKIRTGRAHPSLLEHITVSYYGNQVPLSQAGNITVEDARTLVVTPWERTMITPIEKAIMTSDLGLNPVTNGPVIRVPLPSLTEQRRKDLFKIVKGQAEEGRVAIRNIRRDANTELKNALKDKQISEDEEKRAEEQVQKLTDQYIKEIETLLTTKEQDLMAF